MFWGKPDVSVSFCEEKYVVSDYIAEYYNSMTAISYMIVGLNENNLPDYSIGYVYLPATIIVGIMSSLTAKFGVNIAHRMKQKKLRIAFAFLVMIMALNLLMR